jgi:SulP family sulfate permease
MKRGLYGFSLKGFGSDIFSGLTFAVVNVPQCMAHALLTMVNPVFGIYTLMLAVPVGALFTSSIFMNVSTTSALSVATGAGLAGIPPEQKAQSLVVLVILVGIIQMVMGLFRLGFLVKFVSNAVMTGFLNGVAILIILGQLGDLTGYRSAYTNKVAQMHDLVMNLDLINLKTTFIGLVTLGLITALLFTRARKFAFIIAITLATGLLVLLGWDTVIVVGDLAKIPESLPALVLPKIGLMQGLIIPAFSVAVIGLIQGAGVSQGYPNPDGRYPDVSQDFLGQGIANLVTGFFRGIPAGGSISGTAVIVSAGARSRWTNILVGLFVALIIFFAVPLVELVPAATLSALLIVAGIQGLRMEQALTVWQTSKVSATVMFMTFLATLIFPLHYAVLVGMAFSVLLHVIRESNRVLITQLVPLEDGHFEEQPVPHYLQSSRLTILQLYGSLFFAAAKTLEEMLPSVETTRSAVVIFRLRGHLEMGSTFITVLRKYVQELKNHDSTLMLVGVNEDIYHQLEKTGTLDIIGEKNIYPATRRIGESLTLATAAAIAFLKERSGV